MTIPLLLMFPLVAGLLGLIFFLVFTWTVNHVQCEFRPTSWLYKLCALIPVGTAMDMSATALQLCLYLGLAAGPVVLGVLFGIGLRILVTL